MIWLCSLNDVRHDEVDDGEGKYTNDKTDKTIKNSILSLGDFTGITGGSHVLNTTDNHNHNASKTKNGNHTVDDVGNITLKISVGIDLN